MTAPPLPTAGPSAATPPTAPPASLGIAGLEAVYDTLAQAIDQAGAAQSELFLVKLALLQAEALGDAERFAQLVQAALQDLQPGQPPAASSSAAC